MKKQKTLIMFFSILLSCAANSFAMEAEPGAKGAKTYTSHVVNAPRLLDIVIMSAARDAVKIHDCDGYIAMNKYLQKYIDYTDYAYAQITLCIISTLDRPDIFSNELLRLVINGNNNDENDQIYDLFNLFNDKAKTIIAKSLIRKLVSLRKFNLENRQQRAQNIDFITKLLSLLLATKVNANTKFYNKIFGLLDKSKNEKYSYQSSRNDIDPINLSCNQLISQILEIFNKEMKQEDTLSVVSNSTEIEDLSIKILSLFSDHKEKQIKDTATLLEEFGIDRDELRKAVFHLTITKCIETKSLDIDQLFEFVYPEEIEQQNALIKLFQFMQTLYPKYRHLLYHRNLNRQLESQIMDAFVQLRDKLSDIFGIPIQELLEQNANQVNDHVIIKKLYDCYICLGLDFVKHMLLDISYDCLSDLSLEEERPLLFNLMNIIERFANLIEVDENAFQSELNCIKRRMKNIDACPKQG